MADQIMKDRKVGGLGPALLATVLFFSGCADTEQELPEISAEEGARVAEIGGAAAGELMRTLVGRLTAAMQEGGPANAVEFCSTEAIPLTRMVEIGLEGELKLKRTSFRYRNPANAPDEAEAEALRFFEDHMVSGGEVPSRYVQRVSETELRYYQPLFVGEVCLQCHGERESLSPEVMERLQENYPEDLATGYEAGDLRGVVRVTIPAALLEG